MSTEPHAPAGAEVEGPVMHAAHVLLHAAEWALPLPELPESPRSRWHRHGLGRRGERVFDVLATLVSFAFLAGWTGSLLGMRRPADDPSGGSAAVPPAGAAIAAAVTDAGALSGAYIAALANDVIAPLRGESGKLRASIAPAGEAVATDSLPPGASVRVYRGDSTAARTAAGGAPRQAGIWSVALAIGNAVRPVGDLRVIALMPFSAKRGGRIGAYRVGSWPYERGGAPRSAKYAPPEGFIEVTPENQDTPVSDHFRLRDFLTHDQQDVWPKYLVLRPELIDKLELVLTDLESQGVDVRGVRVMSGFRTPQYNAGGGDPRGRAALSRHMYGDASDIFIDSDGDGMMDDLNHDRRVDLRDARVIEAAVERVERAHPRLVGGCGVYPAAPGHGPFAHIDTRGYRARWLGTGDS